MTSRSYFQESTQLKIQRQIVRKAFLRSLIAFFVSLAIALYLWRSVSEAIFFRQQQQFENLTREMTFSIESKVSGYIELLYSVQRFFAASQLVERNEWRDFLGVHDIQKRYPGILAVRYIERVLEKDRESFVRSVREDRSILPEGYPSFAIHSTSGSKLYTSTRNESYVIKYVEPYAGNEFMMGFDFYEDLFRRKIYEDAWVSGEPSLGPIKEFRTHQDAIVICVPLYARDLPLNTMFERQKALAGFADEIISPKAFFDAIFDPARVFSKIRYEVYNENLTARDASSKRKIYQNRERSTGSDEKHQARYTLEIANSVWTIFFFGPENFGKSGQGEEGPLIVLIAGILSSFLIWGIFYSFSNSRLRAVLLAQQITVDLQESEQRLRAVSQSAFDAIVSTDDEGKVVFWNDGAKRIFGYIESEVVGKAFGMLIPACFYEGNLIRFEKYLEAGRAGTQGQMVEASGLRKDGGKFPAELSLADWERGGRRFSTIIIRDVGAQKKILAELQESHDRYARMINDAADPIFTIDVFECIRSVNPAAERATGFPAGSLVGKRLRDVEFIPSASLEKINAEFSLIVSGQTRRPFEVDILRSDRSIMNLEMNLQIMRRGDRDEGFLAICRDLTERKKAELIRSVEHGVPKVLAEAPTLEAGIEAAMGLVRKAFGWEAGAFWSVDHEAELLRCLVVSDNDPHEYAKATRERFLVKGSDFPGQVLESGKYRWVPGIAADPGFQRKEIATQLKLEGAIFFPVASLQGIVGVLEFLGSGMGEPDRDLLNLFEVISQQIAQYIFQKFAEGELKKAEEALGERERLTMVAQLAAGVAHEVKNPLAIILQGVEFLKNDMNSKSDTALSVLDGISESVARADKIVRGLLELSRQGSVNPQFEDLHSVCETVILLNRRFFDERNIQVEKQYQPDLPKVWIDRGKIEQVILNLMNNAIEAMNPGGRLTIRTRLASAGAEEGDKIVLEIDDEGAGIPEKLMQKVFAPFVTSKRALGGSGLGLPVARSIMEMHHGTIQLENIKPGGARATLIFPRVVKK